MRRSVLVVAMTALLAAMAGCGSSGGENQSEIPSAVQLRLGVGAQEQLRVGLHDRSIDVNDVTCGPASGGNTPCTLKVSDKTGRRGTFNLVLHVEPSNHGVRISWTGTSNQHWREIVERSAHLRRGGGPAASGGQATTGGQAARRTH
jgi:hypothetical protein